jgi:hypothetical protein
MKNNPKINTILLVIIIVLLCVGLFMTYSNNIRINNIERIPANKEIKYQETVPTSKDIKDQEVIPASVQAQYQTLKEKYSKSLGATLELCTKGNEKIYVVSGSGGFSGDNYYYDMKGDKIGFEAYDDIGGNDLKNSIEIGSYKCTVLETSMKYKSQ